MKVEDIYGIVLNFRNNEYEYVMIMFGATNDIF